MNFLSGVDFIFALNVMGDFQMYFTSWRQRSVCHLHDSGPRHQRWGGGWGGDRALQDPQVWGVEVVALCPAWL